ncbi:alpha-ketoacid dehydrogenase subunit beta [Nitratiruptor sp. YY09-18]|uniref:alpha-ketoacid dehydrogenase subunit beta n=1 Tax=Nitratiruptor sp. YY09-18 TaxID=2724901 RepID=UPI0019165FD6|nr:pyruvate dehydrogenase E1 component beta subunit [Nitratiruptor sp. YY09-18]
MLYREALNRAIDEMMEADESVVILGEDVGRYGGSYRVSEGLFAKYGAKRVIDTPIAELSIVGNAIGMAIAGLRPIAEIMTVNFSLLAMDQIVNHAAKFRYMSGGKMTIPLTIRMPGGVSRQLAAQHSESYETLYSAIPGLIVLAASNATYAYYGLKAAIAMNDPVIFLEHELLYPQEMEFKEQKAFDPFKAEVVKEGKDLTILTYLKMRYDVLEAVPTIEKELGISIEVIDLNSLRPLDMQTIAASVQKTKRVVMVEEDHKTGGYGAEVIARITEELFYTLDAPPLRIAGEDVPIAYNRKLELASIPTPEKIVSRIIAWGAKHGI